MSNCDVNVLIGEVKVGSSNDVLHAILGSCVGIAFLYPSKDIYGLAHCLLPKSPEVSFGIGARYVDQAIMSLLKLMKIEKKDYGGIQAVITGGGNMTMPETTKDDKLIGSLNVNVAIECLKKEGISIVHKDVGGLEGRKISLYCSSDKFEIKSISRNIF